MSFPTISVSGDTVPSDQQVTITVEAVEQFSERSPARLRIEFTNEAPTAREFLFETVAPFDALVGRAEDGKRLHAIPYDDDPGAGHYAARIPRSPVDGCWKWISSESEGFGLRWPAEPGATRVMTYAVLDEPDTIDCLPPGEYRFEDQWGALLPDDEDRWHSWGFTAELRA